MTTWELEHRGGSQRRTNSASSNQIVSVEQGDECAEEDLPRVVKAMDSRLCDCDLRLTPRCSGSSERKKVQGRAKPPMEFTSPKGERMKAAAVLTTGSGVP